MESNSSLDGWRSLIAFLVLIAGALLIAPSPSAAQTCGWNIVPSPNTALPSNSLSGVSVVSANDVWAVGGSAQGSRVGNPLTEHWNGTTWTIVPAPQPPGSVAAFSAVSALASNDIWAVGSSTIGSNPSQNLTEHWDGSAWSVVPSPSVGMIGAYPADNFLAGVVAIAPNDVWAVGAATTIVSGEALTLHWDGATWTIVKNPGANPRFYDANLLGITAVSSSNVWAVGQKTTTGELKLIENWNGAKWVALSSPAYPTNVEFLESVSAISASDIWAVGSYTIPNAEGSPYQNATIHWNGTSWSIVPAPQPDPFLDILTGVAAISSNDVWAVGLIGTSSGYEAPEALHWDGAAWTISTVPGGSKSTALLAVAAVSSTDLWAVGQTLSGKKTLIEHFTCQ